MWHFSLKGSSSSGQCCAISCKKPMKFPGFWSVLVSESTMFSQWPLNGSHCFPSKCMVLAIHFKITGYIPKRETLVLSVCTGIVFSGALNRWINPIDCSIAFWWYEFVRRKFYFSIMLYHCEYPLSMNELFSFPWISGNSMHKRKTQGLLMNCKRIHALDNLLYTNDCNYTKVSLEYWS